MVDLGTVPFRPDFRDTLLVGMLTATARPTKLGEPGDVFWAFGQKCVLTAVERMTLDDVAVRHWRDTGSRSASEFIRIWVETHPGRVYDGSRMVWVHWFRREATTP